MKITAAIVESAGAPFELTEVELAEPGHGELLVRMLAVGMCHSDLSVVGQTTPFPLPAVLGHEGVGTVEQVGAGVSGIAVGDRVVLSFTSCRACRNCQSGSPVYCDHWLPLNLLGGARLDGSSAYSRPGAPVHGHFFGQSSFATHAIVSAAAAVVVASDVPVTALAPIGCGVQTGTGAVFNVARPSPGDDLVIFGAGGVGLSAVMAAKLTPAAKIIAVDVQPARLELATSLGATHTINSAETDPVDAIAALTGGGADIAIETSGRVEVLAAAVRSLRASGTCVVIGAPPLGTELAVDVPDLLGRGISLVGTNQGDSVPREGIPRLVELFRAGLLPIDRLVTTYAFADINKAAADARSGVTIKPVLLFDVPEAHTTTSVSDVQEGPRHMSETSHALQFIAGGLTDSARHGTSTSPAGAGQLGTYADADRAQAESAIAAARQAFDATDWSRDRHLRHKVLNEIADGIEKRSQELITMLARENGKVLGEAGFELHLTPSKLRYYAALALMESGRAAQVAPGVFMSSVPEATGVAGIITPWNSPVVLSVRSFAPALAAGCTAVVKMPGQTGLVNGILHEILADCTTLPAGVLNSLTESGDEVSRLLVSSPDVDVISYTGSTRVGRQIMASAAERLKRLSLELGGKTPMIVFDDADLDAVVPVLTAAVTTFSGQFCMTGSRILAQEGIADELKARLVDSLSSVVVGPGDDPTSQMGPMIDATNAERVNKLVEEATAAGGEVLVRGGVVTPGTAFYAPSLVAVSDRNAVIVQEEVFGPVATFETFTDEDDAVALANCTDYGLAASVWSRDVDLPRRVGRQLRVGTVWTNAWALVVDQFEEGGFGQSGVGRLNGLRGLEEFQEYKTYAQVVN